jgi:hypothetical protein
MIRKLKTGEYRLYSRKRIQKPGVTATSARSVPGKPPKLTSARCNTSSITNSHVAKRVDDRDKVISVWRWDFVWSDATIWNYAARFLCINFAS